MFYIINNCLLHSEDLPSCTTAVGFDHIFPFYFSILIDLYFS